MRQAMLKYAYSQFFKAVYEYYYLFTWIVITKNFILSICHG